MTSCGEIGENSSAVTVGLMNCKNAATKSEKTLEKRKEYVQKAAYATLNMLNNQEASAAYQYVLKTHIQTRSLHCGLMYLRQWSPEEILVLSCQLRRFLCYSCGQTKVSADLELITSSNFFFVSFWSG